MIIRKNREPKPTSAWAWKKYAAWRAAEAQRIMSLVDINTLTSDLAEMLKAEAEEAREEAAVAAAFYRTVHDPR